MALSRIAVLGIFAGLLGCREEAKPRQDVKSSQETLDDECQSRLSTAVKRVAPESLATQARRDSVVNAINSWMVACAETEVRKLSISEGNLALLTESVRRTATTSRFSENDVLYVRDCMLLDGLTESIWKSADQASGGSASNTARVVALFRHLIQNMALLEATESRVPVSLYEPLLTGRGTVDDRIWAFAESLRQRQLDAIVIQASAPGTAGGGPVESADLLVGVIVDGVCLLFDPLRGTPVPKPGDMSVLVSEPAELDVLAGKDRWTNASVSFVCHPSSAAPRMLILQNHMEAEDAVVLYEELAGGTSEIRPLLERVGAVVGSVWPSEKLTMWSVPEQRIAAAAILNEEQKRAYELLMRPFDSPFEREAIDIRKLLADPNVDESQLKPEEVIALRQQAISQLMERSDALFGRASRRLLLARVRQVEGNFDQGMIQDLQQIRIACLQEKVDIDVPIDEKQSGIFTIGLPQSILDVQKSAVGDTLYWTAMNQLSRRDYGTAILTLRNYRRQYPAEKMFFPSVMNEAESLVAHGDSATAKVTIQEALADSNPDRLRAQWLADRLSLSGGTPADASAGPASETPVAPAASSEQKTDAEQG